FAEQRAKEIERQAAARREAERLKREAEEAAHHAEQERIRAENEARRLQRDAEAGDELTRGEAEIHAEALRREADHALEKAGQKVSEALSDEKDAAPRPIQAGRTSQKTFMRTFRRGEITDVMTFVRSICNDAEFKEIVQKIANRYATARIEVDGMRIV